MGFLDPIDWNRNGKPDIEDMLIEAEQRRNHEERYKQKEAERRGESAEPPATETEQQQGVRAWVTLGISAMVFLFFWWMDMILAAMLGTLVVMLLLTVFYVIPAGNHKNKRK